jgi:hypothetical protein
MTVHNTTSNTSPEQLAAQAAARKAKAIEISKTTGKAVGLMGVGALLLIGIQKFQNRNNTVAQ